VSNGDFFSNYRLINYFLSWPFGLWGAPFFPLRFYVFHSQWNTLYQFWIHTRAIDRLPWIIELIFNTPSHHRVHHGSNPRYIDKNYGGTLIIFDRIFGTFEPESEPVTYGISYSLGTWNPFFCQLHHWGEMLQVAKRMPTLWQKIRVFLDRGPYFNYLVLYPEKVKAAVEGKGTHEPRAKYDGNMPNMVMSIYGFVHGGSLILLSVLMSDYAAKSKQARFLNSTQQSHTHYPHFQSNIFSESGMEILFGSFILFGMFCISALFDQKPWAKSIEVIRLLVFWPLFGFLWWLWGHSHGFPTEWSKFKTGGFHAFNQELTSTPFILGVAFLLGSLLTLWRFYKTNIPSSLKIKVH
jgi:hypothetical protein